MRSRVERRASMAGWLFADLSIVLAILFIGSSLSSSDSEVQAESSTTTTVDDAQGSSLNLKPHKVTVAISDPKNAAYVQSQLEEALKKEDWFTPTTKFGVVIIHAGTGMLLDQVSISEAKVRAAEVGRSLNSWDRLTPKRWIWGDQYDKSKLPNQYLFTMLEDLTSSSD